MPNPKQPPLPVHPLIENLVEPGQPAQPAVKLSGYVGPAGQAGKVRLYSSLEDLSHYVEFDHSGIAQTAPAPESQTPGKGVDVWVKADTAVRWVHEYANANEFHDDIAKNIDRLRGWLQ